MVSNWNKDYVNHKKFDLPKIIICIDRIKEGVNGFEWNDIKNHITKIEIDPYKSDSEVYKLNEERVKYMADNPDSNIGLTYYHICHCFEIPRENDVIRIRDFKLVINRVIYEYGGYGLTIVIKTRELSPDEWKI
jgi:hypothetical protein